jgi:hypothetical protein
MDLRESEIIRKQSHYDTDETRPPGSLDLDFNWAEEVQQERLLTNEGSPAISTRNRDRRELRGSYLTHVVKKSLSLKSGGC